MGNGGWQRLYFTDPVFGAAARRQQIVDRLARTDIGYDDVRMDVFTVRCAHPDDLVVLDQKRINLHSGAGLSTRFVIVGIRCSAKALPPPTGYHAPLSR